MSEILAEKLVKLEGGMEELKTYYKVKRIGFFGSIVRNDFTAKSDIDIVVEFSEPVGFFKFAQLERFLSKLLGFRVDLVTKNAIKPAVRKSITKEIIYV